MSSTQPWSDPPVSPAREHQPAGALADRRSDPAGGADSASCSEVTLIKGRHRWHFVCQTGAETSLLERLSALARAGDPSFDWFDVALVSHQLRKRLKPGLNRIDVTKDVC
jgi:hypothetical protein